MICTCAERNEGKWRDSTWRWTHITLCLLLLGEATLRTRRKLEEYVSFFGRTCQERRRGISVSQSLSSYINFTKSSYLISSLASGNSLPWSLSTSNNQFSLSNLHFPQTKIIMWSMFLQAIRIVTSDKTTMKGNNLIRKKIWMKEMTTVTKNYLILILINLKINKFQN